MSEEQKDNLLETTEDQREPEELPGEELPEEETEEELPEVTEEELSEEELPEENEEELPEEEEEPSVEEAGDFFYDEDDTEGDLAEESLTERDLPYDEEEEEPDEPQESEEPGKSEEIEEAGEAGAEAVSAEDTLAAEKRSAARRKKSLKRQEVRVKKQRYILAIAIADAVLLIIALAVFLRISSGYRTKYLPGTTINGIEVGESTPEIFEEGIREGAEVYSIDIAFRGSSEHIDGKEIGYHYVSTGEAQRILEEQNIYAWFLYHFGRRYEYKISWSTDYDRNLLKSVVGSFPELQPENETKPENAYLNLEEDLTFSIVPEVMGNFVFNDAVQDAVFEAVEDRQSSVDLNAMEGIYEAPVVYGNNPDLNWEKNNLNSFLSTSVTYNLPFGETRTLDREDLIGWVTRDDNGYYHLEESVIRENARQFVAQMASDIYVDQPTMPFNTVQHGTVQLDFDGGYKVIVNEAEETEALFNNLWNHRSATREPACYRNNSSLAYNMGGSYIEVDISLQHIYLYLNGERIMDAPCVSGTYYHAGYRTPYGVFAINGKMRDATLYGPLDENGEYEYISHVDYWMPFTGNCGFHDAPWHRPEEFGTGKYLYNGSHGCVNLSPSAAETLYEYVYVGLPVIVYYSDN